MLERRRIRRAVATIEGDRLTLEPIEGVIDRPISIAPVGSISAHFHASPVSSGDPALDRVASIEGDPVLVAALLDERTRRRLQVLLSFGGEIARGRLSVSLARLPEDVDRERVIELFAELTAHLATPVDLSRDPSGRLALVESGSLSSPEPERAPPSPPVPCPRSGTDPDPRA